MQDEPGEDPCLDEQLNDIFHELKQKLIPVNEIKDADVILTTSEFYNKIVEHFPITDALSEAAVYLLLVKHGYNYCAIGPDADLNWMAKRA